MKKILFSILALCSATLVFAQTNTFPTSGSVGIGTLSPNSKLQVAGNFSLGIRLDGTSRYIGKPESASGFGSNTNWIGFISTSSEDYLTFGTHKSGSSGGERMRLDALGNLGIGTTSPTHKLSVDGYIKAQGSDGRLMLENSHVNTSIYLRNRGASNERKLEVLYGTTVKYVMDNDGNVGIGTTSPSNKLHILSNTSSDGLLVEGAINPTVEVKDATNGVRSKLNARDASATVGTITNHDFSVVTNNTEKMTISSAGNVGIGTTSPQAGYKLHVIGHMLTSGFMVIQDQTWGVNVQDNVPVSLGSGADFSIGSDGLKSYWSVGTSLGATAGLTMDNNGNVGIGTTSPSHKLQVESTTNNYIRSKSSGANSVAGLSINNDAKEWILRTYADDFFQIRDVNNNEQRLVIDPSNGNIGIGTSAPGEKLEVNGTIRSKRVKVEATGWPDYVFSKNYELRNINEVEAFIKKNHHLPEVPSAMEIEEKGLDLGKMDATLLKKVEELTLYLIEQDKSTKVQAASLKAVQEENDALKKMLLEMRKELDQLKKK